MRNITRTIRNAAACMMLMAAVPSLAFALSLDQAKQQGLVGERTDGYLGIVAASTPDVVNLVKATNNARRTEYDRIAGQTGQARTVVEQLAAKKAYEMTPRGQFVQDNTGGWRKQP